MSGSIVSPPTIDALRLLGDLIRIARIRRRWTMEDLAERLGASRTTVHRLERGESGVAIGTVFEAARLVGVPLFGEDADARKRFATERRNELALLPESVRSDDSEISYDF